MAPDSQKKNTMQSFTSKSVGRFSPLILVVKYKKVELTFFGCC